MLDYRRLEVVGFWGLFARYPPGNDHIPPPTFEDDVHFPKVRYDVTWTKYGISQGEFG